MSNGMCFERYYNQVGMSASTILPPPLKHDTSCLMGCVLNDTAIKRACLLALSSKPLNYFTFCQMDCVLNDTVIKWACLLAPSPPTNEAWYFLSNGLCFEQHCNQVGMSASSSPSTIEAWYFLFTTFPPHPWRLIYLEKIITIHSKESIILEAFKYHAISFGLPQWSSVIF